MLTTKFKMAAKEITFHTHQYIKLSDVYLDITTISKVRDPCRRVRMTEDILRYVSVFHVYRDVHYDLVSNVALLPCRTQFRNYEYIPLISRVFGPYCKLRTEFFSIDLWPARREKTRIRNLQYGPKKRG